MVSSITWMILSNVYLRVNLRVLMMKVRKKPENDVLLRPVVSGTLFFPVLLISVSMLVLCWNGMDCSIKLPLFWDLS